MNALEIFLLDLGLSWTTSKLAPYLLMITIGLLLVIVSRKRIVKKKFVVRFLVKFTLLIIPFVSYFVYSPIYQGDFSNNSVALFKSDSEKELQGRKLVVLSIPGCPYCFNALDKMKKLKERVSNIEIEYLVCHLDPETIQWYKEGAGNAIDVKLAENIQAMSKLASGVFPTFVLVEKDKVLRTWSNNHFGFPALDEIELSFNKPCYVK
jgi:thiol-disulfide isomerase/thioredoxin